MSNPPARPPDVHISFVILDAHHLTPQKVRFRVDLYIAPHDAPQQGARTIREMHVGQFDGSTVWQILPEPDGQFGATADYLLRDHADQRHRLCRQIIDEALARAAVTVSLEGTEVLHVAWHGPPWQQFSRGTAQVRVRRIGLDRREYMTFIVQDHVLIPGESCRRDWWGSEIEAFFADQPVQVRLGAVNEILNAIERDARRHTP